MDNPYEWKESKPKHQKKNGVWENLTGGGGPPIKK